LRLKQLIQLPPKDLTVADLGALNNKANSPNASEDLIIFLIYSLIMI